MNVRRVQAIARKEYYHLIRDFRSLYLAFIIPLLLILLFGYALSLDVEHIPTAVVDHDRTPESRDLIRRLDASVYFDVTAHPPSSVALTDLLDRNDVILGIVIPPGWSADLKADRQSPLQIVIDGSDPNTAGNTRAFITAFIAQANERSLLDYLNRQGRERIRPPVEGRIRVWFNEDLESRNFIVPGIIAVIIMIVGALLTSMVIAREYENGTMETIRSLPVRADEFFLGKAIPYFFITLIDVLVAILMGQVLFGVVMKASFWLMILASTVYILVGLSIGLLISVKTKSQLVANQLAVLVTYLPSLLLSDFVFPQQNMPALLKAVSKLVPATYYIDILNGLYLRDLSFRELWPSFLMLVAMAALLSALNIRALKKEGGSDMNWLRVRELVRKEFIQLFRDRKNRPMLVIAPLIQMILFGYVVTTDVRDITVAVIDQSRTPDSRRLLDAFDGNPTFRVTHVLQDPKELDRLLLQRDVDIGLRVPPDFSARIRRGDTAEVQILVDGSMSNMAAVRIAYSVNVLEGFNSQLLRELNRRHIDFGEIDGRIRTWYNPNLDSQNYYVPGIVAFLVMLLSLLFTSMAVVREKEAGTMEQLIVTPLKPTEFILGKTIPFILIAQAQMVMVILFARLWFQIPMMGNAFVLLAASSIFLLSTLGIGLLISTVSRTQQQAMMTNFFFILPFFMLSGFVFPIANMPAVVQWLTHLNPLSHFLIIIRGVFLKGTGFAILWPQFLELAVLGGVVFAVAVRRFRKRLD